MVEASVGADYSHLIPDYDNSECKETTSTSTNYTFKAIIDTNEIPEMIMVDIPIKNEEENNNDEFLPF